jgi:hypothetical protein
MCACGDIVKRPLPSVIQLHLCMVIHVKITKSIRLRKSLELSFVTCQVALTEKWAEIYKNKGIGFYSMHPGWAETPGVAKSLPDFSKS